MEVGPDSGGDLRCLEPRTVLAVDVGRQAEVGTDSGGDLR